jgi:SAM-dependent methyltransferase
MNRSSVLFGRKTTERAEVEKKVKAVAKDSDVDLVAVPNREKTISKENDIYGRRWESIHNGYFSDPNVAYPLIQEIKQAVEAFHPTVVADLGGGTGFILKELSRLGELSNMRMVNVDISSVQLSECENTRIVQLRVSADQFTRSQLQASECRLLVFARSLLHYFGDSGLRPLLKHIRSQLKKDEIFVHQSACFESAKDAECLSLLYKLMGTTKCYYTVNNLESMLNDSGFGVYDIYPAAKLRLESSELTERYQLSPHQKIIIRREIERLYGQKYEVYISFRENFTAWLHYFIFCCRAI